jgi:hypothetical protein
MNDVPQVHGKNSVDAAVKGLPILITLIGIYAWIGGQAYLLGYWNAFGWDGPIVKLSLPETAFFGFSRTLSNWLGAVAFLLALGVYGLLMELWTSRGVVEQLPRRPSRVESWIRQGKPIDATAKAVFGGSVLAGLFLGAMVLGPLTVWVNSAIAEGKRDAREVVCHTRKTAVFPSSLILSDKSVLIGRFLERSEKFSVVIDGNYVYVVSAGENPKILDKTSVGNFACRDAKIAPAK